MCHRVLGLPEIIITIQLSMFAQTAMCQSSPEVVPDDLQELLGEIFEEALPAAPQPDAEKPLGEDALAMAKTIDSIQMSLRQAAEALAGGETGIQTQNMQREIATMMQAIVDEMEPGAEQHEQQRQSSSEQESSEQSPPREQVEPEAEQPSESESLESGQQATPNVGQGPDIIVRAGPVEALNSDVWGHLPEKTRGRLRAVRPADFLPQYREAITEYYRRLSSAEESQP